MAEWEAVIELLHRYEDALPFETPEARAAYIADIKKEIEKAKSRENDNKRAATLIAVDAAKTFVQIAIALIAAIVGFVQFSYRNVAGWLLIGLLIAGVLAFVSMCAGFVVISRAYKKGDGRISSAGVPWSTSYLKGAINVQAVAGVFALLAFAGALTLFNAEAGEPKRFLITLPNGAATIRSSLVPVVVRGTWTTLSIEQKGVIAISVPPAPTTPQSLKIESR